MNWKIFTTVCVSTAIIFFPQNIIGCGPEADPYDYYTSFFSQQLSASKGYRPFCYTGISFLYDENEPVDASDVLAKEWVAYCNTTVKENDAKDFINNYNQKDIINLYYHLEKARPLNIPDSVKTNSMTAYFIQQKDLEALGYILYAKSVQPSVTSESSWNPSAKDDIAIAKLIKKGQQLYSASKKDLFKLKYAYQVIRLLHYSGNYEGAIKMYDDCVPANKTISVLQPMSLALKAGAMYKTGNKKEAAYLFSKAFMANDVKRVSNYISFNWSVNDTTTQDEYLALCKTKEEKAGMLAMFTINNPVNKLYNVKEVYKLFPKLDALEILVTREINKLEETYFTPLLNNQKGGKNFYYTWQDEYNDSITKKGEDDARLLVDFLASVSKDARNNSNGFYKIAAAYTFFMLKNYGIARTYLEDAKRMDLPLKLKDQWALTNLLITINEKGKIDAAFEEQLLPSVKWLQKKALDEKPQSSAYYEASEWKTFYRNLMSQVLAKHYHAQGDVYKELLVIGSADNIYKDGQYGYNNTNALDYLRNNLVSTQVEKLYALMTAKNNTPFDRYLISNNSLKLKEVIDFAGTAYLRDYKYAKAIEWFNKAPAAKIKIEVIEKNPFIELLNDQLETLAGENKKITKPAFAKEMLRLQNLVETGKADLAKNYYKMALGLYNITYYGYAWQLVQYYRSSIDGYYIPDGATSFQKEYYGCYKAHDYFKKAMDAATDKNFKAKCLFMMAKCSQKQLGLPQYSNYTYAAYNNYDSASKTYFEKFRNNKYFPQLIKEYGKTDFYEEAYNSCSYLKDFVNSRN